MTNKDIMHTIVGFVLWFVCLVWSVAVIESYDEYIERMNSDVEEQTYNSNEAPTEPIPVSRTKERIGSFVYEF